MNALLLAVCLILLLSGAQSVLAADARQATDIDRLIDDMTRAEKIGQLTPSDWSVYQAQDIAAIKQQVRAGKIGGFLNVNFSQVDRHAYGELQRIAVEQSPHGIWQFEVAASLLLQHSEHR